MADDDDEEEMHSIFMVSQSLLSQSSPPAHLNTINSEIDSPSTSILFTP